LFAEPDRLSPSRIAETLSDIDAQAREQIAALPDNDALLTEAISGRPVVVGIAGHFTPLDRGQDFPRTAFATAGGDPAPFLVSFPGMIRNIDTLERVAAGRGFFSIVPEVDGIIRRVPAIAISGGDLYASLGLETLRVAEGETTIALRRDDAGIQAIRLGSRTLMPDRTGKLWVNFGRTDRTRYISAVDVVTGDFDPARIEGRIALLGTSAAGLFDLRATPVEPVIPGVEIHADLIENILDDALLTRPHYAIGAELVLAVLVGLVIILFGPRLGALPMLGVGAAIAALLLAMAWYLFTAHRVLIDVVYPLASSFAVFLVLTFINFVREERRRAQIRTAFGQYLSPDLIAQLLREPNRLVLGGETRDLTILFSDVRGFTRIAESYKDNPQGLTTLMNRLLTPLSNAIVDRRGTIDKYMGDAVMAFWNAPLDDPNHARNGCLAALEMYSGMRALDQDRARDATEKGYDHVPMRVGLGVATGETVVGNMGSDIRFDYSVLGDRVNLASRLEGLTAQYEVPIIIARATWEAGARDLAAFEIDLVRVKGKERPERIFVLLGDETLAKTQDFKALKTGFEAFLEAYRAQNWDLAEERLTETAKLAEAFGIAHLIAVFADRIGQYRVSPPPSNWDAVFEATKK
ncbi:MAG: adenylate/guanylate cyclase domain-containing protein, partial [Pseudomonadota bacterium]